MSGTLYADPNHTPELRRPAAGGRTRVTKKQAGGVSSLADGEPRAGTAFSAGVLAEAQTAGRGRPRRSRPEPPTPTPHPLCSEVEPRPLRPWRLRRLLVSLVRWPEEPGPVYDNGRWLALSMCEPGMTAPPHAPPLTLLPGPHGVRPGLACGPEQVGVPLRALRGGGVEGTSAGLEVRGAERVSGRAAAVWSEHSARQAPGRPRAGRHTRVPTLPRASVLSVSLGSPCLSRSPAATAIFPRKDDGRGVAARGGQRTARVQTACLTSFLGRQRDVSDLNSMHGLV